MRSSAIRPEEEALRSRLEEIEEELRRGRVTAKLNELWALLGAVSASVESGKASAGEWAVVDEEGMAQIIQVRVCISSSMSRYIEDLCFAGAERSTNWLGAPYEGVAEGQSGHGDRHGPGSQ